MMLVHSMSANKIPFGSITRTHEFYKFLTFLFSLKQESVHLNPLRGFANMQILDVSCISGELVPCKQSLDKVIIRMAGHVLSVSVLFCSIKSWIKIVNLNSPVTKISNKSYPLIIWVILSWQPNYQTFRMVDSMWQQFQRVTIDRWVKCPNIIQHGLVIHLIEYRPHKFACYFHSSVRTSLKTSPNLVNSMFL